jgi:signal transduction histidine kinase
MANPVFTRRSLLALPSAEFLPQRVSLLYRLAGKDIPAILLTAGVVAFGLWGIISERLLVAWLIWLVLASLVRLALARAYEVRQPSSDAAVRWEGYFCLASALLGMAWGITVLALYPGRGQLHEVLVPFLIGSVAMGLPATLGPSPKGFACLIAPIMAPMIGLLFSQGGSINTSAGILILVFSAVLLALYLSSHRALLETLRFWRENELLVQQLRETKERLHLALDTSNLLVWEWDERRGSIIFDGRWAGVLEPGKESVVRSPEEIRAILHPDDVVRLQQAQADCMKGSTGEYTAEHRVYTPSGEWRWSLSRGRVVERDANGRALRVTGIVADIDRRKRAEAELMVAVQREKELSEVKSKFLSMASHELRTPLATILSSAELLEHYSDSLEIADKTQLLESIQGGAKRMNQLIDGVLTLGRVESGVLTLSPSLLDLKQLCGKIVAEFCIAQGKRHVVKLEDRFDLPAVQMDEHLLRHILENLLSNAAKYSAEGSEIRIALERQQEQAVIEVEDRGIGIPAADQSRLFETFHRASNVENRPGTGLGLSIVRKSVDLHGGDISFASSTGKGTRFTVRLPLRRNLATA